MNKFNVVRQELQERQHLCDKDMVVLTLDSRLLISLDDS